MGSDGERRSKAWSRHSPAEHRVPRKTCPWMGISRWHVVLGVSPWQVACPLCPWHCLEVLGKPQHTAQAGGGQARGFGGGGGSGVGTTTHNHLLNQGS